MKLLFQESQGEAKRAGLGLSPRKTAEPRAGQSQGKWDSATSEHQAALPRPGMMETSLPRGCGIPSKVQSPKAAPRWVQVRGSLRKLYAAVQLSVFGTATVALFLISLVGSPLELGA